MIMMTTLNPWSISTKNQLMWFFVLHSVYATVAVRTWWCFRKFVDIVRSTVFYWNRFALLAFVRKTIKANRHGNHNIAHFRMSIFQPAWIGIFVPAAPTKRYHPSGSSLSHKSVGEWFVMALIFRLASLRFLWWWQGSATKWNYNCDRTIVIRTNGYIFFYRSTILAIYQQAAGLAFYKR